MATNRANFGGRSTAIFAAIAIASAAALVGLGCHAGTAAAPEGTEIPVSYQYIARDIDSGDFTAIISATVIDEESDVPQVGVGVYFRVTGGPGQFNDGGPIITDNSGHAESVLVARGATSSNKVGVEVSSGPASAELDIDVNGGFSTTNEDPVPCYTITPNPPRTGQDTTIDVACSTDPDCPTGKPTTWTIDWNDGASADVSGTFTGTTQAVHRYPTSSAGQTVNIVVTVVDCTSIDKQKTDAYVLQ